MKKLFIILPVLIFSFIILKPTNAVATSGACSYHSGVNCSAGPTYDGKVQCNDGWINSSVYFSDVQECRPLQKQCTYPKSYSCDLEQAKKQAESIISSRITICVNRGLGGSSRCGNTDYTQESSYQMCVSQNNLYNAEKTYYENCLVKENEALKEIYKQNSLKNLNDLCEIQHGDNSIWDLDKKECTYGSKDMDFDITFISLFNQSIKEMPQYKDIVNQEDLKKWIKTGEYSKLTLPQLIELKYGKIDKVNDNIVINKPLTIVENKKTTNKTKTFVEDKTIPMVLQENIKNEVISITKDKVEPVKKLKWYKKIFNWFK